MVYFKSNEYDMVEKYLLHMVGKYNESIEIVCDIKSMWNGKWVQNLMMPNGAIFLNSMIYTY